MPLVKLRALTESIANGIGPELRVAEEQLNKALTQYLSHSQLNDFLLKLAVWDSVLRMAVEEHLAYANERLMDAVPPADQSEGHESDRLHP